MDLRHQPELSELLVDREAPCLSLYQPTHRAHPDNQQDPIRFRNLVKTLEVSLRLKHPTHEQRQLLARFHHLADDGGFWRHTVDGLAIFGGTNFFRVFKLQRAVGELAIVADTFHTKPLVRILQSADRYQVLALSRKAFRLFEGNRDVLDEVHPSKAVSESITDALTTEPGEAHQGAVSQGSAGSVHHGSRSKKDEIDSDTERFFRAVDRAVLEHHSKPSGLPLILGALTEHQSPFRAISHNPHLLPQGIEINPESLSIEALRERAWQVDEPNYLAALAKLVDEFGQAQSKWLGTDDLASIGDATAAGRVATLLVEANRQVPGRIDRVTGRLTFDDLAHPGVDDLLDDLAEIVLKKGGKVVVAPADRMPTKSGAAAIYRF
jgi:Bacterial archaeo-eukaryotic release factor family 3